MSDEDRGAIAHIIAEQFNALNWSPGKDPDFDSFSRGFLCDGVVIPGKRPAHVLPFSAFLERMERLRSDGTLRSFSETGRPLLTHVIGDMAIALVGCEMTENETATTRDVSAFLFVKSDGKWRIGAQSWVLVDEFPGFEAD